MTTRTDTTFKEIKRFFMGYLILYIFVTGAALFGFVMTTRETLARIEERQKMESESNRRQFDEYGRRLHELETTFKGKPTP